MPDPAPLTAEDFRARLAEYGDSPTYEGTVIRTLLAALDAAEARLADARREALEEAAETLDFPAGEAVEEAAKMFDLDAPVTFQMAAYQRASLMRVAKYLRTLAAPRPTEETTP